MSQLTAWDMRPTRWPTARSALRPAARSGVAGQPYDIAVLDHLMPGMDGLELARRISADPPPAPPG